MARRRRPPRAGALGEVAPLRIAAQIGILQLLYYAVALLLMLFTALIAGAPFTLDLVLGWDSVRGDNTNGWLLAFVWILDGGLCMAIAIVALVTRSKLVPDFALTIHFLHLLIVSLYTRSVPRTAMWWLTMSVSAAFSVTLGVWGCRYRELQPVFFGGTRILGAGSTTSAGATAAAASDDAAGAENGDPPQGDEEMGFARGRGRGRGRDGAGEYEMVKLQPPPP